MSLLTVPETKSISFRGFWDTTRQLKLFVGVNSALILGCIAVFFGLPTAVPALLYFIAGILSVWAGVLRPVEGLACYFSLSFYTALPVAITGSPFLSGIKDVLLVIGTGAYLLTAKYRRKLPYLSSSTSLGKPLIKRKVSQLSASVALLILFIILGIIVLSLLYFRYQNATLFFLGLRAYFFYLLVAVIAYKKVPLYQVPRLLQTIIVAALWPGLVGILQVVQIVLSPSWLPPLTLFSQDEAGSLFQGNTGIGIVQETLELIRTPATLTGVPQFACLNIITGIALVTLISLSLTLTINNIKVSLRQWLFLLLLCIFFFISMLAGGNRMPIAILLVVGTLSFFAVVALPKRKSQLSPILYLKRKRKTNKVVIATGFILVIILIIAAISVYVINLLPDIYMRYVGSIGYQVSIRIEVLATQIEPIFQFPLIDQFFGVGPATQSAGARYLDNLSVSHVGGDLHAESQLLQQAVELGIIFFPIYFLPRVILAVWCLRKLALRKSQLDSGYLLPLAIFFGILTIVPYGNFITLDPMNAFYWLIAGLLFKFVSTRQSQRAHLL